MKGSGIRLAAKGLAKLPVGAIQITLLTQSHAKVGVKNGIVRSEASRSAELGGRALRVAIGLKGDTEVVAGGGKARCQSHRLAVLNDGVVDPPLVSQNHAQSIVGRCVARLDTHRFAKFPFRTLQIFLSLERSGEIFVPGRRFWLQLNGNAEFLNAFFHVAATEV